MKIINTIIAVSLVWVGGYLIGKNYQTDCPKTKPVIPLTEKQIKYHESLVSIDTNNTYFSIDNHSLVQYKSDAIMHLNTCQECLKRNGLLE